MNKNFVKLISTHYAKQKINFISFIGSETCGTLCDGGNRWANAVVNLLFLFLSRMASIPYNTHAYILVYQKQKKREKNKIQYATL